MQLSDLTLVVFLCLGGVRCLSYVPQIIRIARDDNGASAISYATWYTWVLANLATALYAGLNLGDPYLTTVSCIYALCCAIVIALTALKRARHGGKKKMAALRAQEEQVWTAARRLLENEEARMSRGMGPSYDLSHRLTMERNRLLRLRLRSWLTGSRPTLAWTRYTPSSRRSTSAGTESATDSIGRHLFLRRAVAGAIGCVAVGTFTLLTATEARAQDYPSRTVTIVVPFPAGISLDGIARKLGEKLAGRLGQPIIVENRPGAGSIVGTSSVARAAPDGYTLLMGGSGNLAINATLRKSLPYDPAGDFVPLALTSYAQFVLVVNPALPVHSVQDLIRLAKEKPGQLSYASPGPGSAPHLCAELFKHMTGIDIVHVPYKGSPQALTDLVGGHIQLMFADAPPALPLIKAGKVRALGVSSRNRMAQTPDIPPLAEAGVPRFEMVAWMMLVAPSKTPPQIVTRLHAELQSILALPESRDWLAANALTPAGDARSPEELSHFVKEEIARWGKILEQIGIARSL